MREAGRAQTFVPKRRFLDEEQVHLVHWIILHVPTSYTLHFIYGQFHLIKCQMASHLADNALQQL